MLQHLLQHTYLRGGLLLALVFDMLDGELACVVVLHPDGERPEGGLAARLEELGGLQLGRGVLGVHGERAVAADLGDAGGLACGVVRYDVSRS